MEVVDMEWFAVGVRGSGPRGGLVPVVGGGRAKDRAYGPVTPAEDRRATTLIEGSTIKAPRGAARPWIRVSVVRAAVGVPSKEGQGEGP